MTKDDWTGENYTKFNMALMFYISLNKLIEEKDRAFILRDVHQYAVVLRTIYRKLIFKIPTKANGIYTRDKFVSEFKRIDLMLQNKAPSNIVEQYRSSASLVCFNALEDIDMQLTFIMDKHKMIFPDIKVEGGIEKIATEYGVDLNLSD